MLYKRPGSDNWQIKFSANGRTIRASSGTTKRAQAERYEQKLREDIWNSVHLGQVGRRTYEDGVNAWLDRKSNKRSINRDAAILRLAAEYFSKKSLDDITEAEVESYGKAVAEGTCRNNANRHLAMLRSFFNLMFKIRYMQKQVSVVLYKTEAYEPRVLSRSQFATFVDNLPEALRPVALFAAETGLRRANVLKMHWAPAAPGRPWVPFVENGVAHIPGSHAKAGKPITVPLSAAAEAALARLPRTSELVFAGLVNFRKEWEKAAERAGFPGLRFHDLRHAWCSWKLREGTPEHIVQKLGGWNSDSMVKRYSHLTTEDLRKYV